jgi:hypothetical protein
VPAEPVESAVGAEVLRPRLDWKIFLAWAWATLTFYGQVVRLEGYPSLTSSEKWQAAVTIFANVGISVQFLLLFRGRNRDWRIRSADAKHLSIWGYFWRTVVGISVGNLIHIGFGLTLPLDSTYVTAGGTFVEEVVYLSAVALAMWLLFSRDHRGQFRFVFSALRTY